MDVSDAVKLLRPATSKNLRKLAVWAAGEAQRATNDSSRLSAEILAMRYIEEADWIDFQLKCEESGHSVGVLGSKRREVSP